MNASLLDHLHAALTVFPAALFPIALCLEGCLALREKRELRFAQSLLLFIATCFVIAAFLSGYIASDRADRFFEVPDEPISLHHSFGRLLLFSSIPLIGLMWIASRARHAVGLFRWLFRALLLLCAFLSAYTGYLGGELVQRFGAGVHASDATPRKALLPE